MLPPLDRSTQLDEAVSGSLVFSAWRSHMEIRVNDETVTLTQESVNVLQLLEFQEVEMPDMVSVSINGDVLKRDIFETTLIKEGDAVEFVYFMGGGGDQRSGVS